MVSTNSTRSLRLAVPADAGADQVFAQRVDVSHKLPGFGVAIGREQFLRLIDGYDQGRLGSTICGELVRCLRGHDSAKHTRQGRRMRAPREGRRG